MDHFAVDKVLVSVRRLVVGLRKYFRRSCQITNKFLQKLQIFFFIFLLILNKDILLI